MIKNYMIYPLKNMRITCRYDEGSHKNHNVNVKDNIVDYPIDDGGIDSGKDAIYCPCDEMRSTAIRGVGNSSVTNTIWLVSTSKVVTPAFTDYVYITLTHSDDSDIRDLKIGQTFKRGEIICHEGVDGAASNHIHITCGRGESTTWKQNSNGSWVIYGNSKKPEEVFFIDRSFTNEIWGGYLPWVELTQKVGSPVARATSVKQIEVIVDNLNARISPSLSSEKLGYVNSGIYNVDDIIEKEGYTWVKIDNFWIATNSDWVVFYDENKEKEIKPRLIFTCNETGKYIIYLEKGSKLYIS
mgnify:FL=1